MIETFIVVVLINLEMIKGATLLVVICFTFLAAAAQLEIPPVEGWREHLPYHSAISVTAGNDKIYTATPYSLFSVDLADKSIERLSKVNGLSETGISTIEFDEQSHLLFIAYNNSNSRDSCAFSCTKIFRIY